MKAVNLHFLTRTKDPEGISMLYQALSECVGKKMISPHEAASLRALDELLALEFSRSDKPQPDWTSYLDGFFFSYVIEHIGKEFDLLKISSDRECVLNIELKSEDIGTERIRKQLLQNRYYLSHTAHTIFSFTFVMSTGKLYRLNSREYLRECTAEDLVRVLTRPDLQQYLEEGIDRFFRSADYLISPVAVPEQFLQRQYFLTNQQAEFKRQILEHLRMETFPLIAVSGIAGTGKTLLLFDLALELSKKNRVLFLHTGLLRRGHFYLDERLKNVDIRSCDEISSGWDYKGYSYLLIDEVEYLPPEKTELLIDELNSLKIPLIVTFDPHQLLESLTGDKEKETIRRIQGSCTMMLNFSGNIRINRPVYSFLRSLLNLRDHPGSPDYSCIDVLYAENQEECELLLRYYGKRKYRWLRSTARSDLQERVIAEEYNKVMYVLDEKFYYDDSLRLHVRNGADEELRSLYEVLSRTRERLCLIIKGNRALLDAVLSLRLHRL